ncbi:MAG: chemotaxis protein CheB [Pseudomonadales bacterium]|nr:chemotaxis protein CheB [Pseudomonadales bacterium]
MTESLDFPQLVPHVVVIGASWGGIEAIIRILRQIPDHFPAAVVIVQHRHSDAHASFDKSLRRYCTLPVREVEDKDVLQPSHIFLAPANYHMLLERDLSFSLCLSAPVFYCRPSIDVTMQSMASVLGHALIGVLLTGANEDGAEGLWSIQKQGGLTIAQDPEEAAAPAMPLSAIARGGVDKVIKLKEIIPYILGVLGE